MPGEIGVGVATSGGGGGREGELGGMTWEEREVELITQVLCRVELPDQPVYAALVEVREAVRCGDKRRMMRATQALTDTFLECVREGFRIGVGESPWVVLARQEELLSWSERLGQRMSPGPWPGQEDAGKHRVLQLRHCCAIQTSLTALLGPS